MDPSKAVQAIDLSNFYWIVGAMFVVNLGTIVTLGIAALKFTWNLSSVLTKLEEKVKKNGDDVNAAHLAIKEHNRWHLMRHSNSDK